MLETYISNLVHMSSYLYHIIIEKPTIIDSLRNIRYRVYMCLNGAYRKLDTLPHLLCNELLMEVCHKMNARMYIMTQTKYHEVTAIM